MGELALDQASDRGIRLGYRDLPHGFATPAWSTVKTCFSRMALKRSTDTAQMLWSEKGDRELKRERQQDNIPDVEWVKTCDTAWLQ